MISALLGAKFVTGIYWHFLQILQWQTTQTFLLFGCIPEKPFRTILGLQLEEWWRCDINAGLSIILNSGRDNNSAGPVLSGTTECTSVTVTGQIHPIWNPTVGKSTRYEIQQLCRTSNPEFTALPICEIGESHCDNMKGAKRSRDKLLPTVLAIVA